MCAEAEGAEDSLGYHSLDGVHLFETGLELTGLELSKQARLSSPPQH